MQPVKKILAPAKLNLFLRLWGKRNDGFHEIETVMQTVDLYDELSFSLRPGHGVQLICQGDMLPPAKEDNLVYQAARLLQERFNAPGSVHIELRKKIPPGAGLGGGSSDAAATLRTLSSLWELDLQTQQLEKIGAELGSDVPFFIRGGASLCRGRGEVLHPLETGDRLHFVIVLPPIALSTAKVYDAADSLTSGTGHVNIGQIISGLKDCDPRAVGENLRNDLKEAACTVEPRLAMVERRLQSAFTGTGCCGYGISGSGSAWYGIYSDRTQAVRAAERVRGAISMPAHAVQSVSGG